MIHRPVSIPRQPARSRVSCQESPHTTGLGRANRGKSLRTTPEKPTCQEHLRKLFLDTCVHAVAHAGECQSGRLRPLSSLPCFSKVPQDATARSRPRGITSRIRYSKLWIRGTGGLTTSVSKLNRAARPPKIENDCFFPSPCRNLTRTTCTLSIAPVVSRYVCWTSALSNFPQP